MKTLHKISAVFITALLLFSCSGGDEDPTSEPTTIDEIQDLKVNLLFEGDSPYADELNNIADGDDEGSTVNRVEDRKRNANSAVESTSSSYIKYSHDSNLYSASAFTISIWAKPNGNHPSFNQNIFYKDSNYALSLDSQIIPVGGILAPFNEVKTQIGRTSPNFLVANSAPYSAVRDQWDHYAIVITSSKILLYVNGELKIDKDASGDLNTSTNDLYFGGNVIDQFSNITVGGPFAGAIDDFKFYNRALTEQEVGLLAEDK